MRKIRAEIKFQLSRQTCRIVHVHCYNYRFKRAVDSMSLTEEEKQTIGETHSGYTVAVLYS